MPPPFSLPPPLQPYDKSDYQIIKEGGWNNMHDFIRSYNLKTWEPSDYEMAKQILEGFREIDQQAWEEQYGYHGEFEQDYHRDDRWNDKYNEQFASDFYHNEQDALEYQYYEQEACEYDYGGDEGWDDDGDYDNYGDKGDYGYY